MAYRKSIRTMRKQAMLDRLAAMRKAKERKRLAAVAECGMWKIHEHLLRFSVSPCGRFVAVRVGESWERCGSERSVRAVLARAIWRKTRK